MLHLYINTDGSDGDGSIGTPWNTISTAITALEASGPNARGDAVTVHYSGATTDPDAGGKANQFDIDTTAARYLVFEGDNTTGKWSTAHYRLAVTNRNGIYNNVTSHLRLKNMQVQITATSSTYIGIKMANANLVATDVDLRCSHCIVKAVQSGGAQVTAFENRPLNAVGHGTSKFWNDLAIDCQNGFVNDFIDGSNLGEFYNCTAADCSFGFVVAAGTNNMKCVNCISTNPAGNAFIGTFTTSGSDYNADDDGNGAEGANSQTGVTFTFNDRAADDFSLSLSDTGALGLGIANPGSGLFSDDLTGATRPASWARGALETGVPPPTLDQEGYRFRNDDGSETAATWKANQDADVSVAVETNFRLRTLVNGTGDPAASQFQLEAALDGTSNWFKVNTNNG